MIKIILLNGPLAVGKSTVAKRYADDNPLTLNLDIDQVRNLLGSWREHKEASIKITKLLAASMIEVSVTSGHDVIIAWMIRRQEDVDFFKAVSDSLGATFCEIMLYADRDDAVSRCVKRGFRPGGSLDRGGREVLVARMYDEMITLSKNRPAEKRIKSVAGDVEGTYTDFRKALEEFR